MAGAGYKLFNTGDVLTAAQVNTYLMEQTVMVFNDAAARTTALSGVVSEGMISYLKDTNAVEVYNGSAWVASDDPNAIQNTIVDAKGDLITATAADTPARLASSGVNGDVLTVDTSTATGLKWAAAAASSPLTTKGDLYSYSTTNARLGVGANGETLLADSGTTTGLRWQGQFMAGKNAIINGDFRINQRNFTSVSTGQFTFDRWSVANSGGSPTFSAQTFTLGAAPVAGYEARNFIRLLTSGQSAAGDLTILFQKIEDVRTFANQTITVSFWAKANTGTPSIAIEAVQNFGTGGSPSATVTGSVAAGTTAKKQITTSWARYSATLTVPTISGKTIGTDNNSFLSLNLWVSAGSDSNTRTDTLGIQSNTFDIWGVQVEAGSVATPFTTATGTLAGELAACQRYYYRAGSTGAYAAMGFAGFCSSTTNFVAQMQPPVTMRVQPTALDWSSLQILDSSASSYTVTTATLNTVISSPNVVFVTFDATGMTATRYGYIRGNNSTSAFIGVSAEL